MKDNLTKFVTKLTKLARFSLHAVLNDLFLDSFCQIGHYRKENYRKFFAPQPKSLLLREKLLTGLLKLCIFSRVKFWE